MHRLVVHVAVFVCIWIAYGSTNPSAPSNATEHLYRHHHKLPAKYNNLHLNHTQPACMREEWECPNIAHHCIPIANMCDGVLDCENGLDEHPDNCLKIFKELLLQNMWLIQCHEKWQAYLRCLINRNRFISDNRHIYFSQASLPERCHRSDC